MKATFKVRTDSYDAMLERVERGEGDKFNPYRVTVSGQKGGPVTGTVQVTDSALEAAEEKAKEAGGSSDDYLATACGRSLAAEVLIRELAPDFSFVVDHRWL